MREQSEQMLYEQEVARMEKEELDLIMRLKNTKSNTSNSIKYRASIYTHAHTYRCSLLPWYLYRRYYAIENRERV